MTHLVSAASPEMPSSLGGEGRRRVVEGEVGRGEEVLEFWRWMAGRWATMNQVKHGRRRHGPVRTCPVQGRASRKDNYVFRSDRRISARLGHDTDSSRLRARCLRVNVQRSSVNSLSSCEGVSISDEIKIIAIYVRNGSKNASGIPDNRDREFGVFLNKEEKLGNSFESLVDDFQVKVIDSCSWK